METLINLYFPLFLCKCSQLGKVNVVAASKATIEILSDFLDQGIGSW